MCGIFGFTGEKNTGLLHKMAQTLRHRGPDDDGFYADGKVNLGLDRLSIVDPATGGQPVSDEAGKIIAFQNGEIYNHRQIRAGLETRGHRFRSGHSDTEVIPHLYKEKGTDWPAEVNGMFAAVIWDKNQNCLFLYRDRVGEKPLYYSTINGQLVFASEIKAILEHPGVSREIDHQALYHYFESKSVPEPYTVYRSIRQLPAGHYLRWSGEGIKIHRYWDFDFTLPAGAISEEEAVENCDRILSDSVRLRMDCDVPFGAYLSGGMDSGLVVRLMRDYGAGRIKTFCLGYEENNGKEWEGKTQDLVSARQLARALDTEHHEFILSAEKFAAEMPAVLRAFDQPFSGTVSTYFLSQLIKRHVKVALSGDGADELYGSYLAHRLVYPIEHYRNFARQGKNRFENLTGEDRAKLHPYDEPESYQYLSRVASGESLNWRHKLNVFSQEELQKLLHEDFLNQVAPDQSFENFASPGAGQDSLNQILQLDQKELLRNQVLPFVDRLSMAHSVEVRIPYLDPRLVEYVNHLPGHFKIRNGITKYLLREVARPKLPAAIINRPKEGFVQPVYQWMHERLKPWMLEHLRALPSGVFRSAELQTLIQHFDSGERSLNAKIWNLVCFSLWWNQKI